jgi:signal transduction histidine kinase
VREFAEGMKSEGNRVAEIARDHGGDLAVESEEGRYARFHLDLHAETE